MKKPFGNITKLKKQKPSEPQTVKQQPNYEPQNVMQPRPPTGKLKMDPNKQKGNIYDSIRRTEQDKQQGATSVHKPTLGFKKNKLGLGEKKQGGVLNSDNNRGRQVNEQVQESTQNLNNLPRPTPLFNRNKGKLNMGKSKQKPVISPQEDLYSNLNNNNRMAYVNEEEQQTDEKDERGMLQDQSKKLIKPNLFKGMGDKKGINNKQLNTSPNNLKQQKLLNNSQVYQQYEQGSQKKQKFNFQKMMNVETAQINLQRQAQQVPLYKIQKQNKRARQLSNMLNLEIDLYEQMTSISSTTPFEVYISKIKGGFLKNSCDEAFDQKNDYQCQTSSYEYIDFSNQCPQDYQLGHGYQSHESQSATNFDQFILKVSPLIEQLLKPSKNLVMPPTSLLAFTPVFKSFLKCPSPTFIYFSQKYNFSLVAIGQKLYISEDQIECALDMGGSKLAGLKNGKIVLWNGENDRGSSVYGMVKQIIQSQNFQLPVYVTNDFDKLSPYLCEGSVVALLAADEQNIFFSFDSTAKMIKWGIQKVNRKTQLVPKQVLQFSKILQKKHMVGIGLKKRNQTFYLLTSCGIICWNGHSVTQKLQTTNIIKQFYLPKRSNLIICLTQFNTIQIFSIEYHQILDQIRLNFEQQIQQLIIPQIQHENREISLFYQIYLVAETGVVYEVKLMGERDVQWKKVTGGGRDDDEQEGGSKSKRNKSNVIYQGVNVVGNKIEKIKLFRDLKCTTQIQLLTVDLSSNVNNLKTVLTNNKQFVASLMDRNMALV